MKLSLAALNVGDIVRAEVHEILDAKEIIFSFNGDLLRVLNDTGRTFKAGDEAVLRVKSKNPLQFQFSPGRNRRPGHIDVSV